MKRVAVTGMGLVAPCGNDPEEFFANLVAGRSGIGVLRRHSARLSTRIAAAAPFDAGAYFSAPRLRMLDRVSQLALAAAEQALRNAAIELSDEERAMTGVFLGTGMGGGQAHHIFAADSDFILASLAEDLGLTGLMAILVVVFILVERGMRIALASRELFIKMLASGLAFVMCFQLFVVLGGLTRIIPLTGMTTPFLAAGGSALMASWLMIGLLLRMSDNARRPAPQAIQDEGATQVIRR